MRRARRWVSGLVAAVAFVGGMLAVATPAESASATAAPISHPVNASAFTAGNLISDAVFYYTGTDWTAAQVQAFLDGQVPACRTGYTCLKNYTQSTLGLSHDLCNYTGKSSETAAQIIANVGAACGINPQVLLTLVQKEQRLVTDTWPLQTQYDHATGWLCPDTSACDANSAGFFTQVLGAAWQFIQYGSDPGFNWFPVGKVTNILYSPGCTTSAPVAIWNRATAALYYYTPYQPDPAALANFFGNGDTCSEYGNRNFWGLFTQWFGNPTAGATPTVTRSAGADRYTTAVSVSAAAYPTASTPVKAVYIASGTNFPDALGAAPAAAAAGRQGPLLLVSPTAIPSSVVAELKRLKPVDIYVLGGTGAVSAAVSTQLASYVASVSHVHRLAGTDRFGTSRVIATTFFSAPVSTAYIATGLNYPDALSAGAAAGAHGAPVILVNGGATRVDAATKDLLTTLGVTTVKIIGGTGAVSAGFEASLTQFVTTQRLSGTDRYLTSVAVNTDAFPGATTKTFFATGLSFPDALAGAAAAGAAASPLYVVKSGCVDSAAAESALASPTFTLLGGTAVLGANVSKLTVCP